MRLKKKKIPYGQVALHAFFLVLISTYLIPFMMVLSVSFSDEQSIVRDGYQLIPKVFSLEAYKTVFSDTTQIVNSYRTTIIFSVASTALSLLVMALMAYPLARSNYKPRKFINVYILFTMLFSAGLVPSYILSTQYLKLQDTIWVYILPGLVSAYHLFIIRTNYKSLPGELIEAAKLDGASELTICFRIVIPLTVPALASIGFLHFVTCWNNWSTSLYYIKKEELFSLQYLLQRILQDMEILKEMADSGLLKPGQVFPRESTLYATAVVAAGPVLFIFPFFQKYFSKGLTVGSVKG